MNAGRETEGEIQSTSDIYVEARSKNSAIQGRRKGYKGDSGVLVNRKESAASWVAPRRGASKPEQFIQEVVAEQGHEGEGG